MWGAGFHRGWVTGHKPHGLSSLTRTGAKWRSEVSSLKNIIFVVKFLIESGASLKAPTVDLVRFRTSGRIYLCGQLLPHPQQQQHKDAPQNFVVPS